MPDLFSIRAANAFNPVGRICFCLTSSLARLILIALQMLPRRRGKPNLVTDFVNALPNSVDPTEAERLIHRLEPCDARLSRILFVKPNPKLSRRRVILLQPGPEIRGGLKKLRFQPICVL